MTEQNLGKDFETLLGMLRPEESVNKDDIKILKEQIFGPNVFWVTETRATDDILDGGIVVCWQLLIFSFPAVTKVHLKMMLKGSLGLTSCATESLQAWNAAATVEHHHRLLHKGADAPFEMWLWPSTSPCCPGAYKLPICLHAQLEYNS